MGIRTRIPTGEHYAVVRGIEVRRLVQQYESVGLLSEQRPQRGRDFPWRERAGCHLIKQRLKEMKVSPVDERDLGVIAKGLGGVQSAKTPAKNDDFRPD